MFTVCCEKVKLEGDAVSCGLPADGLTIVSPIEVEWEAAAPLATIGRMYVPTDAVEVVVIVSVDTLPDVIVVGLKTAATPEG